MCSQILVFIIWPVLGGTGLVAGQRSRRWDFMAKAERYRPLVKERGLAAVQKQRGYRMSTVVKWRGATSQRKETVYEVSEEEAKVENSDRKTKKKQRKCVRHT